MTIAPSDDANLITLKIVLGGRYGVGKTSIRRKYLGEHRFKRNYLPTIGSDFSFKDLKYNDLNFRVLIWDLAGEVRFRKFRSLYFQGASGALLVFDITDRESFDNLDEWALDLKNETATNGVPVVILGNKTDLVLDNSEKCASDSEITQKISSLERLFDNKFPIEYFEVSALTGKAVDESFSQLIRNITNWTTTEISG